MAKHIVTAPLVVIYEDGQQRYLRAGAEVPDTVDKGHVGQLLDAGLIEKVSSSPAEKPTPTDPAKMTGPQLKAYAAEKGIDLGEATKVDDVRAVVIAATTSPASDEGSDGGSDSENQE